MPVYMRLIKKPWDAVVPWPGIKDPLGTLSSFPTWLQLSVKLRALPGSHSTPALSTHNGLSGLLGSVQSVSIGQVPSYPLPTSFYCPLPQDQEANPTLSI